VARRDPETTVEVAPNQRSALPKLIQDLKMVLGELL
jgi:hypothetical protein